MAESAGPVIVPIRLPGDLVQKIDAFTVDDGDNRTAWIRRAIVRAVKERERRAKQGRSEGRSTR